MMDDSKTKYFQFILEM